MSELIEKFEKKFGEDKGIFVHDEEKEELDVISTGTLSLDISIGRGGIPKGKFTQVFGPEMSGKTTLMLNITKNALRDGDKVLYIDTENTLDHSYVRHIIGEDTSNLIIAQPETAEEAMSIAEFGISGDKKFDVEPGTFGLIILDSVGALAPEKEKENKLTDDTMMLTARLLSKWFRRNAFAVRRTNTAFIMVNQVRAKIGMRYATYDTPGGNALRHYMSLSVMLYKGQELKKQIDGESTSVGVDIKFVVRKNKLAPPFRSSSFPLMFDKGIELSRDAIEFATMLGVIKKKASYYQFENETIGQGKDNTVVILNENKELLDKIQKKCYNVLNLDIPTRLNGKEEKHANNQT